MPKVDYAKAVRKFKRPSVNLERGETFTADEIRPPPVHMLVSLVPFLFLADRRFRPGLVQGHGVPNN